MSKKKHDVYLLSLDASNEEIEKFVDLLLNVA